MNGHRTTTVMSFRVTSARTATASRLAAAVLGDVIGQDLGVVVRCPFVAAYVRGHAAEYPMVELRD